MSRAALVIVVNGEPAPQGSKRHVGNGRMIESSAKVAPWRANVTATASGPTALAGAVRLVAVFTLARPRSHYGTGRNAGTLKTSAPAYPATRPDVDKLLRSTLDGLSDAGVWEDDSRVVEVTTVKCYPGGHLDALDHPGAVLLVEPMGGGSGVGQA